MLASVLTATLNLLLFRSGPQDFPFDPRLTGWLVPLAALVNYFVLSLVLPPIISAAIGLAVVIALSFATRMFLRTRGLEARFMQTYHALLAVTIPMTLLLMVPFAEIAPELKKLSEMTPGPTDPIPELQVPSWAALTMNLLNFWNFAVNAHIFRSAGNMGLGGGLIVALLVAFGVLMFVLVFASFVAAIVGGGS